MAIDCRPLSTQQASKTDVIKKIAILYPLFLGGGAESVTLWMLQALIDKYDLTLFTFSYIDFAQLDRQFGTQLDGAGVHLRIPFYSLKYVRNAQGYSLMTIRQHLLAHYFRNIRLEFDLAIAAFNEMDLGCQGIHIFMFHYLVTEMKRRAKLCVIQLRQFEPCIKGHVKFLPVTLMNG